MFKYDVARVDSSNVLFPLRDFEWDKKSNSKRIFSSFICVLLVLLLFLHRGLKSKT
jgi:hypothetical protein